MDPTECTVRGSLALVLRVSRCAGVAPLRMSAARDGAWQVIFSRSLAVFQAFLITVLNLILLAALILDFQEAPEQRIRVGDTVAEAFIWIIDYLLVITITSLAVYCGPTRMKNLIRIIKQLQKIHFELNDDPCALNEKMYINAIGCMLGLVILIGIIEVYLKFKESTGEDLNLCIMILYGVYDVINHMGLLTVMQWGFTAAAAHAGAVVINRQLRRLLESHLKTDVLQVQFMIRRLAFSYDRIGEVMRQMNATDGSIIVAVLMSTFLHLVITLYYLLTWLDSSEAWVKSVLLQLLWGTLHLVTLLLTVEPCHWTQKQRKTTKYLLSRLIVHVAPRSAALSQELHQFAKHAMLVDVNFTPLGVHTLGRPFTAAMLGGVTTYVVILMQFQEIAGRG